MNYDEDGVYIKGSYRRAYFDYSEEHLRYTEERLESGDRVWCECGQVVECGGARKIKTEAHCPICGREITRWECK